jgi:hypothetical protein
MLGWLLGQYRFDRYKKEPSKKGPRVLLTDDPARIAETNCSPSRPHWCATWSTSPHKIWALPSLNPPFPTSQRRIPRHFRQHPAPLSKPNSQWFTRSAEPPRPTARPA